MRIVVACAGALFLTACGSNDVPSPSERQQAGATAPAVKAGDVLLRGDGLTVGAESFYFAAGQSEVQTALSEALGEATGSAQNDECGAGPMEFVDYSDDLRVHFQNGSLVGWIIESSSENVAVVGDIQVGSSRADTSGSVGFEMFAESTLGEEFSLGPDIGGFFGADEVSTLYAGTQCFFR